MEGRRSSRLVRWRYHALTLALALSGLALVRAGLTYPQEPPPTPLLRATVESASVSARGGRPAGPVVPSFPTPDRSFLRRLTPTPTPIPVRYEVITYTVVQGDTLLAIAARFGVNLDTVIWANEQLELDPDLINIGDKLNILPVVGVWHTVHKGETLKGIASYYKVTPDAITGYAPNTLSSSAPLSEGQKLIIPGGEKPFEAHVVYTEAGAVTVNAVPERGRFIWPCSGRVTTVYSKYHLAIDIANSPGTPIYAADSGTVVQAGELGTLGNNVKISHTGGLLTSYGHMQKILVQVGEYVQRGQQIGEMGSTGKSTGPHTHFIIRLYDGAVNPVRYLPRQ